MRYHLTLVRMAIILTSLKIIKATECGEKRTLLHCWRKCKMYSHYGEYGGSLKIKNRPTIWSSNPSPGHIFQENSNLKRYVDPGSFQVIWSPRGMLSSGPVNLCAVSQMVPVLMPLTFCTFPSLLVWAETARMRNDSQLCWALNYEPDRILRGLHLLRHSVHSATARVGTLIILTL